MKNIFYCPQCKKLKVNLKFDSNKDRDRITWNNPRGGWGRCITHIICPNCNYELSGIVNIIGLLENKEDESDVIEYFKSVIEGYSNGAYCDSEKILEIIKKRKRIK